jgi:hypothetical protein
MWGVRLLVLCIGVPLALALAALNVGWMFCLAALSLGWMCCVAALSLPCYLCDQRFSWTTIRYFLFPLLVLMEHREVDGVGTRHFWTELFFVISPTTFLLSLLMIFTLGATVVWLPFGAVLICLSNVCPKLPDDGCVILMLPLVMISYLIVGEEEEESEQGGQQNEPQPPLTALEL